MIAQRNLRAGLVTTAVGLAGAGVAAGTGGSDGFASALLGLLLALLFLSAGSIPFVIAGDTRDGRGSFAFLVLALNYALRLVFAAALLKAAAQSSWVQGAAVGLNAIACTAAWTAVQVYFGLARKHAPTLDVADPPRGPV